VASLFMYVQGAPIQLPIPSTLIRGLSSVKLVTIQASIDNHFRHPFCADFQAAAVLQSRVGLSHDLNPVTVAVHVCTLYMPKQVARTGPVPEEVVWFIVWCCVHTCAMHTCAQVTESQQRSPRARRVRARICKTNGFTGDVHVHIIPCSESHVHSPEAAGLSPAVNVVTCEMTSMVKRCTPIAATFSNKQLLSYIEIKCVRKAPSSLN
jgi:hypothetical protein